MNAPFWINEKFVFFSNCSNWETFVEKVGDYKIHRLVVCCHEQFFFTIFEYEAHTMTGNGKCVNLQKLVWKISWNHFWWTSFRRVLDQLEPLCAWVSEAAALIFGKEEKKFFYLESSSRNWTLPVVMSRQFTLLVFVLIYSTFKV